MFHLNWQPHSQKQIKISKNKKGEKNLEKHNQKQD